MRIIKSCQLLFLIYTIVYFLLPSSNAYSELLNSERCTFSTGDWCETFLKQKPVTWKPAPRDNKDCPSTKYGQCNGVGNCNAASGLCECPAPFYGTDCSIVRKRPCTRGPSNPPTWSPENPESFIGPDKRDLNWTVRPAGSYSRCAGICDDNLAICYCDGPKGRINAPDDSSPGTPPLRRGRPLCTMHRAPSKTYDGVPAFGDQPYNTVYGRDGWCNSTTPSVELGCEIDDLMPPFCDAAKEAYCPGQCSGHGECDLGFCRCDPGYYGTDCSRLRKDGGATSDRFATRPWLAAAVAAPAAAAEPPPRSTRLRPLIYVYDMDPTYLQKMYQYRVSNNWCVWRTFDRGNASKTVDIWAYALDSLLHDLMLGSEHRTFDPEEADFFYVPHQASCFPFPIMGWSSFPYFPSPAISRVGNMVTILSEVQQYISLSYPFWNRTGGKDHIFLFTHDEGACWAPNAIKDSIFFTHWGRKDFPHVSNTAFEGDLYDRDFSDPRYLPQGFVKAIQGHACYRPEKDLVIPAFKSPTATAASPMLGHPDCRTQGPLFHQHLLMDHFAAELTRDGIKGRERDGKEEREGENRDGNKEKNKETAKKSTTIKSKDEIRNCISNNCSGNSTASDVSRKLAFTKKNDTPPKRASAPAPFSLESIFTNAFPTNPAYHSMSLLFFRGDVGKHRKPNYSRGVRQKLYAKSVKNNWLKKYRIRIGSNSDIHGSYSELLAKSLFCLVAAGDGWSPRFDDAIQHGCIPVVIQDDVDMYFQQMFNHSEFSIRIQEKDVERLPEILLAISPIRIRELQANIRRIWNRFRYATVPLLRNEIIRSVDMNLARSLRDGGVRRLGEREQKEEEGRRNESLGGQNAKPDETDGGQIVEKEEKEGEVKTRDYVFEKMPKEPNCRADVLLRQKDPSIDDAFSTIMQWLYSKIPPEKR